MALSSDSVLGRTLSSDSESAPASTLVQGTTNNDAAILNSIPSNLPTDMPRFQRTVGSTLKGALWGLVSGGLPGAIEGAASPTLAQKHFQQNEDMGDAKVKFASAQAAEMVAQADFRQRQLVHFDEDHQRQVFSDNLNMAQRLMEMGFAPSYSTKDDGHSEMAAMENETAKNGAVPPTLTLAVGQGQMLHFDLTQPGGQHAMYQAYADLQKDLGKPVPPEQVFMSLPPAQRFGVFSDTAHYWNPPASQNALSQLESDRATLASLPSSQAPSNRATTLAHLDTTIGNIRTAMTNVARAQGEAEAANIAAQTPARVEQATAVTTAEERAKLPFKKAQAKFEEALKDGDPRAAGQLLVNGDVAPSQIISARKPAFAQQAFTEAKNLDPNWNAQAAEGYYKTASSPQNVQFFGSAKSLSDSGGTLDQLEQAYSRLPNGQIPTFNKLSDYISYAKGGSAMAGFMQTAIGVADDYSKVMGGGQGSDTSRLQVLQSFSHAHSPEQMQAAVSAARLAVDSQMSSRIGSNPVMRRMYGDQLLIHVKDPVGGDHVFRKQEQANAFRKAIGQ